MAYKYITENNLFNKQTYMYSEYRGIAFLQEYWYSRYKFLDNQKEDEDDTVEVAGINLELRPVQCDLLKIKEIVGNGKIDNEVSDLMNAYVKSFEVRKRIYEEYDSNWRPVSGASFENYELYLLFAGCLLLFYQGTKKLKYFSCLLKVDDSILSIQDKLTEILKRSLCKILIQELDIFCQLANENGVRLEKSNDN